MTRHAFATASQSWYLSCRVKAQMETHRFMSVGWLVWGDWWPFTIRHRSKKDRKSNRDVTARASVVHVMSFFGRRPSSRWRATRRRARRGLHTLRRPPHLTHCLDPCILVPVHFHAITTQEGVSVPRTSSICPVRRAPSQLSSTGCPLPQGRPVTPYYDVLKEQDQEFLIPPNHNAYYVSLDPHSPSPPLTP